MPLAPLPSPPPAPPGKNPGLRDWFGLFKQAVSSWLDDYAPSMGAALSYYTVFSLGPVMLLVISIAGLVFGEDAAQRALFGEVQRMMGRESAEAVQGVLANFREGSTAGTGTAVGLVVLLVVATTVFAELQDALDRIWRAPTRGRPSGPLNLIRSRFLSFGMILGIAFLLMVSLVFSAVVSALTAWWGELFGPLQLLVRLIDVVVGFGLTTMVFAMIYKLMPRVKVQWRDVWIGAAITALLFSLGKVLIGLYIGRAGIASGWGAAGSVIVIFVWVYWAAQVFLLGAEFTWVYAKTYGSMRDSGGRGEPVGVGGTGRGQAPAAVGVQRSAGQDLSGVPPFEARAWQPPR